jgi:hypothetical protein
MKIESLTQAATVLQSYVLNRQKAYAAVHQQQKISSDHPAFGHCHALLRCINHVAAGDTQKWNIHDIVKQYPGLVYISKKKWGEPLKSQQAIIDSCVDYMRKVIYTHKSA